jgi:hypothetical protein
MIFMRFVAKLKIIAFTIFLSFHDGSRGIAGLIETD